MGSIQNNKHILIIVLAVLSIMTNAQNKKTVMVSAAGTLSTLLSSSDKTIVTNLTITGFIDARDIKYLRDEVINLDTLDLEQVTIKKYEGASGTYVSYSYAYPENELPIYSFCVYNTDNGKKTLRKIKLPDSITSIGSYAFNHCYNLTGTLIIPSSVTSIGSNAFYRCGNLTHVKMGNSLKIIGNRSFYYCSGLKTIDIGTTESIGTSSFNGCSSLKIISCSSIVPPKKNNAFSYVSPAVVYVPAVAIEAYKNDVDWQYYNLASIKHVEIDNVVAGSLANLIINSGNGPLSSISHITIKGNVNEIDLLHMKTNMTALTDIDLSNATIVNNILPANAFKDRTSLTSVKLPNSIQTIGDYAFAGCELISDSLKLPLMLNTIGKYSYSNCSSLVGNLIIPEGVTTIAKNAFEYCKGLSGHLILPISLYSIDNQAFYACEGLSGPLTIPNSVLMIGNNAFAGCHGFTGMLRLPQSLYKINSGVFSNCFQITEVYIEKNISIIDEYAFFNCSGLKKIYVDNTVPPIIFVNTFSGIITESCSLEIPIGSKNNYQNSSFWGIFINVNENNFNSINSTSNANKPINIYSSLTDIIVTGANIGSKISVYNIDGSLLKYEVSNGENMTFRVNRNSVYIIKIGEYSTKIIIR